MEKQCQGVTCNQYQLEEVLMNAMKIHWYQERGDQN